MGNFPLFPTSEVGAVKNAVGQPDSYLQLNRQERVRRIWDASPSFRKWTTQQQADFSEELARVFLNRKQRAPKAAPPRPSAVAAPRPFDLKAAQAQADAEFKAAHAAPISPVPSHTPGAPPVPSGPPTPSLPTTQVARQIPAFGMPPGPAGTTGLTIPPETPEERTQREERLYSLLTPEEQERLFKALKIDAPTAEWLQEKFGKRKIKQQVPAYGMPGQTQTIETEEPDTTIGSIFARAAISSLSQWYSPAMLLLQGMGRVTAGTTMEGLRLGETAQREKDAAIALGEAVKRAQRAGDADKIIEYTKEANAASERMFAAMKGYEQARKFTVAVQVANTAAGISVTAPQAAQAMLEWEQSDKKNIPNALMIFGPVAAMTFLTALGGVGIPAAMRERYRVQGRQAPKIKLTPAPEEPPRPGSPPPKLPFEGPPPPFRQTPRTPAGTPRPKILPPELAAPGNLGEEWAAGLEGRPPEAPPPPTAPTLLIEPIRPPGGGAAPPAVRGEEPPAPVVPPKPSVSPQAGPWQGGEEFTPPPEPSVEPPPPGAVTAPPTAPTPLEGMFSGEMKIYTQYTSEGIRRELGIPDDVSLRDIKEIHQNDKGLYEFTDAARKQMIAAMKERGIPTPMSDRIAAGLPATVQPGKPSEELPEGIDYKAEVEAIPGIQFRGVTDNDIQYHDTVTGQSGTMSLDEFSPDDLRSRIDASRRQFAAAQPTSRGSEPPLAQVPPATAPPAAPPAPAERRGPGRPDFAAMSTPDLQTYVTDLTQKQRVTPGSFTPLQERLLAQGKAELDRREAAAPPQPAGQAKLDAAIKELPDALDAEQERKGVKQLSYDDMRKVAESVAKKHGVPVSTLIKQGLYLPAEKPPNLPDIPPEPSGLSPAASAASLSRPEYLKPGTTVLYTTPNGEALPATVRKSDASTASIKLKKEARSITVPISAVKPAWGVPLDEFTKAGGDAAQHAMAVALARRDGLPVPEGVGAMPPPEPSAVAAPAPSGEASPVAAPAALPPGETPRVEAPPEPSGAEEAPRPKPEIKSYWMNAGEIDEAVEAFKDHPVLGPAARFLEELRDETNAHSDGWHSWPLPGHAAGKLMGLVHGYLRQDMGVYPRLPEPTEKEVLDTLGPIRSFYTKRGYKAGLKWPSALPEKPSKKGKAAAEPPSAATAPPPPAEAPARGKKPKPAKDERLEPANFFKPGRVVWNDYWHVWDKVISFEPVEKTGGFHVRVVKSDADGNPLPGEHERTHSTRPEARDLLKTEQNDTRRAAAAETAGAPPVPSGEAAKPPEPAAPPKPSTAPRSYKVGAYVGNDPAAFNAQRFATKEEAEKAGSELFSRWFAMKKYEVFPSDDAPNYRFNDTSYRPEPITTTAPVEPANPKDEFASSPEKLEKLNKLKALLRPKGTPQNEWNPEIIVAAADYGEELYKEGYTDFAKWSNKMLSDVGEEVRPFLSAAWDRVEAMYGGEEEPEAAPAPPVEGVVGEQERVKKLTKTLADRIRANTFPLHATWTDLEALAKSLVGGDPGDYIDDLYDSIEGAFNRIRAEQALLNPLKDLGTRVERENRLEDDLPKRTKRTIAITELQQFSTPFPLAEGARYAGDIRPQDVVMEPNGGTGNLIAPLIPDNSITLKANEIDPRRVAVMEAIGVPNLTINDYLQLEGHRATVVLMNPPWGAASTGRYANINIPSPWGPPFHDISERFVVKALRDTDPGGRVVALMPTTILRAAGFMKWLRDNHTLRALIASPPRAYERRGTKVDSLLLVVDKGKYDESAATALEPIVRTLDNAPQTWDDWVAALKPLSDGGTHARSKQLLGTERPPQPAVGAVHPPTGGGGVAGRPSGRPGAADIPRPGEPAAAPVAAGEPRPESIGPAAMVRRTPEVLLPYVENLAPARRAEFEAANASPVFIPYVPRQSYGYAAGAQLHPRQVVETRSLAGVPYPELTVQLGPTMTQALNDTRISVEQADAIAAQIQANQKGYGMIISDDVGVGKSREALGTGIEWIERGMAGPKGKILYISAGETNLRDVEIEMKNLLGLDENAKSPYPFIYLRDYPNSKEKPNVTREPLPDTPQAFYMVEAHNLVPFRESILEAGFGGVIGDEIHKLRNVEGAARGRAWRDLNNHWLEQKIPMALFTATPAQKIDDIEYLYPLREWTPDGFQDFVDRVKGRLTAEQVRQRQEKKQREGRADRKALNYIHSLETPEMSEFAGLYYRGLLGNLPPSDFMRFQVLQKQFPADVLKPLDTIFEEGYQRPAAVGPGAGGVGLDTSHVPINQIRQARKGNDVFRRDVSTAELEQIMRELKMAGKYRSVDIWRGGLEFNEFPSNLNEKEIKDWTTAINFIRECMRAAEQFRPMTHRQMNPGLIASQAQFAVKRYLANLRLRRAIPLAQSVIRTGHQVIFATEFVSETDETRGNIGAILGQINTEQDEQDPNTGEITHIHEIPEAVLVVNELRERAPKEFPKMPSPIETIKDAFGEENVADLSGNVPMAKRRKYMADFQAGIRPIAIMSPASSTGINLHHVAWTKNEPAKGRRAIIMMDYKWNAEDFKQGVLGRADRSGQLSIPTIHMQTLGMAAEKKFIATLANRLKDVGAIAKGAAESVGAQPLLDFETGGNIDLLAMRDMWYRDYISDRDKLWFRGNKFIQAQKFGDQIIYRPQPDIRQADLKDFMLQLQLMPLDVGNRAFDAFMKRREELYAEESTEDNVSTETQKGDGDVTRVRQLQPDLNFYEVKDKANHKYGILVGMITDKAAIIRPMMPGDNKKFTYLTFRDSKNGEPISGLRIPFEMIPVVVKRLGAKELLKHTPENALEDLRAGDTIPLANGWSLYMGRAGGRAGKIIINGATLKTTDRGALIFPHGGAYNAKNDYFVVKEDRLQDFLKRFPIAAEEATPEGEEPDDMAAYEKFPNKPPVAEIRRRMPYATEGKSDYDAEKIWSDAAWRWSVMPAGNMPNGEHFYVDLSQEAIPYSQARRVAQDPNWTRVATVIHDVTMRIADAILPPSVNVSRVGLHLADPKLTSITFGLNRYDPTRTTSYGVFINPLGALETESIDPGFLGRHYKPEPHEQWLRPPENAAQHAYSIYLTIVHELAHTLERGHGAAFQKALSRMHDELAEASYGYVEDLARALVGQGENIYESKSAEWLREASRESIAAKRKSYGATGFADRVPDLEGGVRARGNEQVGLGVHRELSARGGERGGTSLSRRSAEPPAPSGEPERTTTASAVTALRSSVMGLDEAARLAARLYETNVKRHAITLGKGVAETLHLLAATVAPRTLAPKASVDIMMRAKGLPDKTVMMLSLIDYDMRKMFDGLPKEANVAFIDRFKRGEKQPNPELQTVADFIQKIGDDWYKAVIWEQIQDLHPPLKPTEQKRTYEWGVANLNRIAPLVYGDEEPRGAEEKVMKERFQHLMPYLENHLRVFWNVIPGSLKEGYASIWQALRGRRSFQGSKGFMRQHTLPDMSAGIEAGGEPVTHNPMTLLIMDVRDHARFVAARRAFRALRQRGIVKFFRTGAYTRQAGFEGRIDDQIAKVYFRVAEGLVQAGEWRTDPDTARLFNNHLGEDKIRKYWAGRSLLWLKNATTAWELGLSLFHGVFETSMAMGVQTGVGLARAWNLGVLGKNPEQLKKGVGEVLTSPLAPGKYLMHGRQIIRYIRSKQDFVDIPGADAILKAYPQIDTFIDRVLGEGGGMIRMHEDYRLSAEDGFLQAMKQHDYTAALGRAVPGLMQAIMTPLFDYIIPAYKLGYAAQLYFEQRAEKDDDIRAGRITETELARRVWDQVDNLFGELNYDNLFWNKTFKSIAQMMFRSVTWYFGSIRTPVMAGIEQGSEFKKMLTVKRVQQLPSSTTDDPLETGRQYGGGGRGALPPGSPYGYHVGRVGPYDFYFRPPRLSPSMAAVIGIMMNAALISVVYMMIKRKDHSLPDDLSWKDMVAPRTGKMDEYGHEERVRFPSEFWTLRGLATRPLETFKTAQAGFITRLGEAISNRDFFNNYVYNPDAPVVKEALDVLAHIAGQPISVSVYQQAGEKGQEADEKLLSFFGMRRAPLDFDLQPDERLALSFLKRRGEREPSTHEQAEVRAKVRQAAQNLKDGKISLQDVGDMLDRGEISSNDYLRVSTRASEPWIFRLFLALHPAEKIEVFKAASPKHKTALVNLLYLTKRDMMENLQGDTDKWDAEMRRLVEEYRNGSSPPAPSSYQNPYAVRPPEPVGVQ